jgi:hypothetical protein
MRLYLILFIVFACLRANGQGQDTLSQDRDTASTFPTDSVSILYADSLSIDSLGMHTADTLSIIGVGDIMMGTNYPEDKLPPND